MTRMPGLKTRWASRTATMLPKDYERIMIVRLAALLKGVDQAGVADGVLARIAFEQHKS